MERYIEVPAPAKLNLTLEVVGRRDDGYHALRSVMQTLELHDTLELRAAATLTFHCDLPSLADADNLVMRAARLLCAHTDYIGGAEMTLHKRIPLEAGLGGGSSDAAATLLGLNHLWQLGLTSGELATLGARLGSDVPFFFGAPTALVEGRGERVTPLAPIDPVHVVLVKPAQGVSTARVFAAFPPDRYSDGRRTEEVLAALARGATPEDWPLHNDLQERVAALYPAVAKALATVQEAGGRQSLMTGSGSTVYALCADEADAAALHARLVATPYTVISTRTANQPIAAWL